MEKMESIQRDVFFDSNEHQKQHKARINNNCHYIRAQNQVFTNINSIDKLIAYSLNQNCQSIAKTKYQQIESLFYNFRGSDQAQNSERQKIFKNIIKNRFPNQEQLQEEQELEQMMVQQEQEEHNSSYDDEDESEEEEGFSEDDEVQIEQPQQRSHSSDESQHSENVDSDGSL